jgi:hypothetical protein
MFSVLWSDPRLYDEKPTITDNSVSSVLFSCQLNVSLRREDFMCAVVIARLL